MINETLQRIKDPVPNHMSFTEYYEQILETILMEMGIHKEIGNQSPAYKKYVISADTAKEALHNPILIHGKELITISVMTMHLYCSLKPTKNTFPLSLRQNWMKKDIILFMSITK